ncbi:phage tape measure protein [Fructilactobacillus fructivorans]|nr:phage tape measure protein [Fructilactobacillus fructivorans]
MNGFDQLEKVTNMIQNLKNDFEAVSHQITGLGTNFSSFGNSGKNSVNEIKGSMESLKNANSEAGNGIKALGVDYSGLREKSLAFSKTANFSSELHKNDSALSEVKGKVNGVYESLKKVETPKPINLTAHDEVSPKVHYVSSELGKMRKPNPIDFTANDQVSPKVHYVSSEIEKLKKPNPINFTAKDDVTPKVNHVSSEMDKLRKPNPINFTAHDEATPKIKNVKDATDSAEKSSHRFRDTLLGTFAGNIISNGFQSIVGGFGEIIKAGQEYNRTQDTMKTVWTALTTEAPQDGKNLVNFINDMASHSIYASETLDKMAQSFYHVHSNEKETKNWTNDFVALGSTLHMSNDALAESGQQFAKIVAGGKANSEDMNVMINRFPMFGEALQKATGKSMKQLYQMSAQGKLTAKQFEDALTYLGKKYKSGTAEAMTSFQGMSMYIKQRASTLAGDVEKSAFNMSKSGTQSMKELLSDKMMKQYAKGISEALGKATETFVKMLKFVNQNKEALMKMLGSIVKIGEILAGSIWKTVSSIIMNIAKAFGLVGDNSKKSKGGLDGIANALEAISKHERGIQLVGKAIVAAFAVKKLSQFTRAAKDVGSSFSSIKSGAGTAGTAIGKLAHPISLVKDGVANLKKGVNDLFLLAKKNPWILVITTLATLAVVLYKTCEPFRDLVNKLFKVAKDMFSGVVDWIGKTIKGTNDLGKGLRKHQDIFKALGLGLLGIASAASGVFVAFKAWQGIAVIVKGITIAYSAFKTVINAVKIAQLGFNLAMLANPLVWIPALIVAVIASVVLLYNKCKPFRDFVNKIGKEVKQLFGNLGKWIGTASKNVSKFFSGIGKWWDKNQKAQKKATDKQRKDNQKSLDNMRKDWDKLGKNIGKMWDSTKKNTSKVWNNMKKDSSHMGKDISKGFNNGSKWIEQQYNGLNKWFGNLWNGLKKDSKNIGSDIGNSFKDAPKTAQKWMNELNDGVNKAVGWLRQNTPKQFQNMWNDANKISQDGAKLNSSITKAGADLIHGHWDKLGGDVKGIVTSMWNGIKDLFKMGFDWINDLTGGRLGKVVGLFKDAWNNVKNGVRELWDDVKSIWDKSTGWVKDKWDGLWKGVESTVKNAVNGIHHAVVGIARGVIEPFNKMLGGLHDGINWVLDKVGADKIKGEWKISEPSYATGTNDTHPGGPAKVNDGPGSNYREMYQLPNGQVGIFPAQRNLRVLLPKGTSVLDGDKTAGLMARLNMPSYKGGIGKVVGDVVKGAENVAGKATKTVTGAFKGIWDKGADLVDMSEKIMKDPAGFLNVVFDKFVGGLDIKSNISLVKDSVSNFPGTIAKGAMKWIKGLFSDYGDAGGSKGNPGGSGVQRWKDYVKKALGILHLSTDDGMVSKVLRQIATESSGNPNAVQGAIGDINNKTGNLARGLMQVIPPTFNAFKLPGHGNIMNGFDNILAGLNYAKSRYGSGLGALGNGHGYANGGHVNKDELSVVGERGPELFKPDTGGTVIDHESSKSLVKNNKKNDNVKIDNRTTINVQNTDEKGLSKLQQILDQRDDDLAKKFRNVIGGAI